MLICGVDEVGRGALAGPLLAAAALLDFSRSDIGMAQVPVKGVRDSKQIKLQKDRETVFSRIMGFSELLDFGIGEVSAEEINRYGIVKANALAFTRAIEQLSWRPDYYYVDGETPIEKVPLSFQVVQPKADAKFWPVSMASIIAKVIRDRLMGELDRDFPAYGWDRNMGYGSARHKNALKRLGPSPHHRSQFIKKIIRSQIPRADS